MRELEVVPDHLGAVNGIYTAKILLTFVKVQDGTVLAETIINIRFEIDIGSGFL